MLNVSGVLASNIYCSSHDACRNIRMACGSNSCMVQTHGSGHDAFQDSEIDARNVGANNVFKLNCLASGLRDCTNNVIWCPTSSQAECDEDDDHDEYCHTTDTNKKRIKIKII